MARLVLTLNCGCAFVMHDGPPSKTPMGQAWERLVVAVTYEHHCPAATRPPIHPK